LENVPYPFLLISTTIIYYCTVKRNFSSQPQLVVEIYEVVLAILLNKCT